MYYIVKRLRFLPRWMADTAMTGLSDAYRAFCVASEGYRDFFIRKGVRPEKIVVTGIPNFDDCRRYCTNDFPYRHYVLACTSNLRELLRHEDREAFIRRLWRSPEADSFSSSFTRTKRSNAPPGKSAQAPAAMVFTTGSAEEMIANCDALITRFSSTAFVGVALGRKLTRTLIWTH